MAADDVAAALCNVTLAAPLNNTIEIAGPQPLRFEDFIRQRLRAAGDQRAVVADPHARYFGARLSERTLLPGDGAQLGPTRFGDWLSYQAPGRGEGLRRLGPPARSAEMPAAFTPYFEAQDGRRDRRRLPGPRRRREGYGGRLRNAGHPGRAATRRPARRRPVLLA